MIKTWYCECGSRQRNFGDIITKILLEKLTQHTFVMKSLNDLNECDVIGIGSILNRCTSNFSGSVWTTGLMYENHLSYLPLANIIAVRGQLTLDRIKMPNKKSIILGDGGLLVDSLIENRKFNKIYTLGLIPHYIDQKVPFITELKKEKNVKFIDIRGDYMTILEQASQCNFILSSSLHGLILADSLNIPNKWIELSDKVHGKGFKYRDYYSVFGMKDIAPYKCCADINKIISDFEKYDYNRKGIDSIKENLHQSIKLI